MNVISRFVSFLIDIWSNSKDNPYWFGVDCAHINEWTRLNIFQIIVCYELLVHLLHILFDDDVGESLLDMIIL